ncbi:MAG: DNA polymerase III subunit beta, partial [Pseudomonadota bacterium]
PTFGFDGDDRTCQRRELRLRNGHRAAGLGADARGGRAVKLSLSSGKLILSVNNPEGGSATEELEADYGADALEIGFNAKYLLDIAGQLESDTASFKLADASAPTMVADGEDDHALYVLMPMRV